EIRETYGLDLRMFRRWVRKYRDDGLKGLEDRSGKTRKTEKTREKSLPPAEKIQRLEAEIEFLSSWRPEGRKKTRKKTVEFKIITELAKRFPVSLLCKIAQVSRSGYYKWLRYQEYPSQKQKEEQKLK
ncbi:leucine zipper domain-containing protein, partial [Brevibacillus laterosporus]